MKSKIKIANVFYLAFLASFFYSILRYNVLKGVPWTDLPIYVLNKSIALTIVILIFYTQINKKAKTGSDTNLWLVMFVIIVFHVILSTVILMPEYYGKFYNGDQLNLVGSLSLLFGILAFLGFFVKGILLLRAKLDTTVSASKADFIKLRYLNYFFLGVHLFVMGINGWLTPDKWPGYLLPISLIAFILLISSTLVFTAQKNKS